ncbi:YlbF family regulator [Dethiothermospora halolimnae]|uniref:YlbF family regulator n=1 Tax=Dethiothermospora halolimnae TaxID=3114390 RepID=UPI003CCBA84B
MKSKKALDKARELARAIVESEEYILLKESEKSLHNDKKASDLLSTYNKKLDKFNEIKFKRDEELLKKYHEEITKLKDDIDNNTTINNLYRCQKNYDNLISNINNIINYFTGNDKKSKCGNCSGCKG